MSTVQIEFKMCMRMTYDNSFSSAELLNMAQDTKQISGPTALILIISINGDIDVTTVISLRWINDRMLL